jgi:MurNAc alpha-1-phosphate uridylyltransferase
MRPITDELPKPLVKVGGRPLVDHALDRLADIGINTAIVNVHHLADRVISHLADRKGPRIIISDEREELLETGGGVLKALPELGEDPFFLLNSDSFWLEGPRPNLKILAEAWDTNLMDVLLMLAPTVSAVGYEGRGDFFMDGDGHLTPRSEYDVAPFVYTGVAIVDPLPMFVDAPVGPFSLNLLINRVSEAGRLFGVRMDGEWFHVGTPTAINEAEQALQANAA